MLRTTSPGVLIPTIRDLVGAIRQRDGVDAAILLGRDGLLIDGQALADLPTEDLAALVPSIVSAADELGAASARGPLTTGVFEFPGGLAVASVLSDEAILLVLVQPSANIGQLLFELRRNREQMAAIV